jgi:aspartyl-tRNA(Asn)/glutamyl-tRNA(Gln) amidotransferase subunit A
VSDLLELSLCDVVGMLDRREATSAEITEATLRRIEAIDGELHSYITVDAGGAVAAATRADSERASGRTRGPLHGVPLAVKDNLSTAGLRTTYNSRAFADHVPTVDTPAVARLRAAGAILIGKTNLNEFGWSLPSDADLAPPVRNPWQPSYQSIGSSSGSGSAVAAGLAYAALGTDGGGSTRLPASQHGLVGLKPTAGAVPREPAYNDLSVVGVLARTVDDAVAVYDAIADRPVGPLGDDALGRLRLGVPQHLIDMIGLEDDVRTTFAEAVGVFRSLGVTIEQIELRSMDIARVAAFTLISAANFTAHENLVRASLDLLGPMTRRYILTGAFARASDVMRAQRVAELVKADMDRRLHGFDGVLTPVSPSVTAEAARVPSEHREGRNAAFTSPFNLTGWPAISIPAGMATLGLPIGVQVAGRPGTEAMLLTLARAFRNAAGSDGCGAPVSRRHYWPPSAARKS